MEINVEVPQKILKIDLTLWSVSYTTLGHIFKKYICMYIYICAHKNNF